MTSVGDHGLICLDGNNYAAVPLVLQTNAQAIDAALTEAQANLVAYGNRYTARFVSTSPSVSGANSGNGLPDGSAATIVVSAFPGILPQGWYGASASLSYQATGAVTAGTYRRSIIQIGFTASKVPPAFFQSTTDESGTGTADSATVNGWFFADGISSVQVSLLFGHGNTGSTMSVPAGAVLTLRYLSSGLVI